MNDFVNIGVWVLLAAFWLWALCVLIERLLWAWDIWVTPWFMRWYRRRPGSEAREFVLGGAVSHCCAFPMSSDVPSLFHCPCGKSWMRMDHERWRDVSMTAVGTWWAKEAKS